MAGWFSGAWFDGSWYAGEWWAGGGVEGGGGGIDLDLLATLYHDQARQQEEVRKKKRQEDEVALAITLLEGEEAT